VGRVHKKEFRTLSWHEGALIAFEQAQTVTRQTPPHGSFGNFLVGCAYRMSLTAWYSFVCERLLTPGTSEVLARRSARPPLFSTTDLGNAVRPPRATLLLFRMTYINDLHLSSEGSVVPNHLLLIVPFMPLVLYTHREIVVGISSGTMSTRP
jgi:hypothetical protein